MEALASGRLARASRAAGTVTTMGPFAERIQSFVRPWTSAAHRLGSGRFNLTEGTGVRELGAWLTVPPTTADALRAARSVPTGVLGGTRVSAHLAEVGVGAADGVRGVVAPDSGSCAEPQHWPGRCRQPPAAVAPLAIRLPADKRRQPVQC